MVNVPVAARRPLEEVPEVGERIRDVEGRLGGRGRVLVRYSGTEPLLRVMVEGEGESLIQAMAQELAEAIRQRLG
jgi:phosphoglucosamine mutase